MSSMIPKPNETNKPGRSGNSQSTSNRGVALTDVADPTFKDFGEYADEVVEPEAEEEDEEDNEQEHQSRRLVGQYTVDQRFVEEAAAATEDSDPLLENRKKRTIYDRENDYQRRRFARMEHADETEEQRMKRNEIEREEQRVHKLIEQKQREIDERDKNQPQGDRTPPPGGDKTPPPPEKTPPPQPQGRKRKKRWDVGPDGEDVSKKPKLDGAAAVDVRGQDEPPQRPASWEEKQPVVKKLSDEMLTQLLPSQGFEILEPPDWYQPVRKVDNAESNGYAIPEDTTRKTMAMAKNMPSEIPGAGDLQFFKESDMKYFNKLLDVEGESRMSFEEAKERKIMRLLLKIKNGTPPIRKVALRNITDNARLFGAKALFEQILPILMEHDLEDQERHLMVKVIDRVLYQLRELVRPYTNKIMVAVQPLLIDEDRYARLEGQEIISNLAKAAGLSQMIKTMRPDIDSGDRYVRDLTANALAVVASALGIQRMVPFLAAVCKSKKSAEARHTGAQVVEQIAKLCGSAVLPHLEKLVSAVGESLGDTQPRNKTRAANALAALAEVSAPYGFESFQWILGPLEKDIRRLRGRTLAGFLRLMGSLIPLMDEQDANYYGRVLMEAAKRNFSDSDGEMRRVLLKVIRQCANTMGVSTRYLREEVLPDYFKHFWVVRNARENKIYWPVVETTVELSHRVGVSIILNIVGAMKHETPVYRRMSVETVDRVVQALGVMSISERLEELMVDGIMSAVQLQDEANVDKVVLNAFGTIINALGLRAKKYIAGINSMVLQRLESPSDVVREQAADLVSKVAVVMKHCGEDEQMGIVGQVLYEHLGEEYPNALGSIIGGLKAIVQNVGMRSMNPPIQDLLPSLTPILKNRHEKVQENAIDLVGMVAKRTTNEISPKEWMRIVNELLEMLRAHKKGIRRAANSTFGYIAESIGPQDVLATLLTHLRVQERQLRVCVAVAIGIVAETCKPFTVLPAVLNEYRMPEKNVQNGVLKSLTFMFEYIGSMAKDYVYAIAPLLEDALMDRDQVHRQTAATVVKHIALGTVGMGLEDVMLHFLNMLIPNVYETSPHVINRILDGIDGVRNAVGPGVVLSYTWAGLFHPARKVRTPFWRIYNSAYVQQADAMVPYYPDLKEQEYQRPELDLWI